MNDLIPFNFDGLDESAIGFSQEHGALVHKTKFMAWLGFDKTHNSRLEDRVLQPGDVVKGIFSPIGLVTRRGRRADALSGAR